jgi:hypothetical protein
MRHDHVEQPCSLLNMCHFTNASETKQCVGVDMLLVLNHAKKTESVLPEYMRGRPCLCFETTNTT